MEKVCLAFGLMTTVNEIGVRSLVCRQIIIVCMKYFSRAAITNIALKQVFNVLSDVFY
jgi:hypothetical protein